MHSPPLHWLSILPPLLHQVCEFANSFSMLGPGLRVFLAFAFFGMLSQSNLTPSSSHQFNATCHTCHTHNHPHPLGLRIVVRWSTTVQSIGRAQVHVLPISEVPSHPTDPVVVAFGVLLLASPTTDPNQLLLMVTKGRKHIVVTTFMLAFTNIEDPL